MKKAVSLIAAVALSASLSLPAAAEEDKKCHTELEESPNLLVNVVTIPFKVVMAFLHLPRCVIDHFPTEESEESEG